jgi:hypothetical protein
VLTSDVLEHVADAYSAHGEIFRVLRSGGRHIFTVPFAGTDKDDVRAHRVNGGIEQPPRCLVWVATASRGADLVFLGSAESRFSAPA